MLMHFKDPTTNKKTMMNARIHHIDIAKGLSIALVVICHSKLIEHTPELIHPMGLFRMPLFFLLSGVFFNWHSTPITFLSKKANALLKPYFFVSIAVLMLSIIEQDNTLLWQIKGTFYSTGATINWKWVPLWFLTHLFIIFLFSYVLMRAGQWHQWRILQLTVPLLMILVGGHFIDLFWYQKLSIFSYSITVPGLPFSLDLVVTSAGYFLLGRFLRNYLVNFQPSMVLLLMSIACFYLVVQLTDAHIDFNKRLYQSPVLATLAALSGIYIVIHVSYQLSHHPIWRTLPLKLGQASLYILVSHQYIMVQCLRILDGPSLTPAQHLAASLFSVLLGAGLPTLCKAITLRIRERKQTTLSAHAKKGNPK